VPSLCSQSVPVVFALGGLCVTRYLAPRGVQDGAMGLCDDGDNPTPRAHTGRSRARVDGSHQDIVTLVVSGGTAREAQFDLMSLRASGRAGPASAIESPSGSRAQRGRRPQRAETRQVCPIAPIRPLGTVSGRSANLLLGA
jgi:hypothetical protein